MSDIQQHRSPGAIAKPAQSPVAESPAATSCCSEALSAHQDTVKAAQSGKLDTPASALVLSNCLADGQIPDCSNVLQNKVCQCCRNFRKQVRPYRRADFQRRRHPRVHLRNHTVHRQNSIWG